MEDKIIQSKYHSTKIMGKTINTFNWQNRKPPKDKLGRIVKTKSTSNLKTLNIISNGSFPSFLGGPSTSRNSVKTSTVPSTGTSMNTSIGKNQFIDHPLNKARASRPPIISKIKKCKSHKNFKHDQPKAHNPVVIPKVTHQTTNRRIKRIKSTKMLARKNLNEDAGECPRKNSMVMDAHYRSNNPRKKSSFNERIMNSYKQMINSIFREDSGKKEFQEDKQREALKRNKSISNFNNSVNYHRRVKKQEDIEKFVRHNRNRSLVESSVFADSVQLQESRFNHDTFNTFDTNFSNKLFNAPGNMGQLKPSLLAPVPERKIVPANESDEDTDFNFFSLNQITRKDQKKNRLEKLDVEALKGNSFLTLNFRIFGET